MYFSARAFRPRFNSCSSPLSVVISNRPACPSVLDFLAKLIVARATPKLGLHPIPSRRCISLPDPLALIIAGLIITQAFKE